MIKLYTAPAPNGRKASIALEEIGVPYEVIRVDVGSPDHPTPEFLALNPNGRIPCRRSINLPSRDPTKPGSPGRGSIP